MILMEHKTERIEMRASFLKLVDKWRRKQRDGPSRAVAIRRLVERALASSATRPPLRSKASRRTAANLAGREVDRLGDQAASGEERARRKRQLIEGPQEFRDLRKKRRSKGMRSAAATRVANPQQRRRRRQAERRRG